MAREARYVDIADMQGDSDWVCLVEELRTTRQPALIRAGGKDVAVLAPVQPGLPRRRSKAMTADDPLSQLVGSATDAAPSDAAKKHEYLAEALAPWEL